MRRILLIFVGLAMVASACAGNEDPEAVSTPVATPSSSAVIPAAVDREVLDQIRDKAELEKQERAERGDRGPRYAGSRGVSTMGEFIRVVADDVDSLWSDAFANSNAEYVSPSVVVLEEGDSLASNCEDNDGEKHTATSEKDIAFFCAAGGQLESIEVVAGGGRQTDDPIIYISAPLLFNALQPIQPENFDFAMATVVAHEFGHHVQYRLLLLGELSPDDIFALPGKYIELSADCFSGVWAAAVYYRGDLEDTDVEEAMAAVWAGGSDLPAPEGTPGDHGTREERVDAWQLGFSGGDPDACLGRGAEQPTPTEATSDEDAGE